MAEEKSATQNLITIDTKVINVINTIKEINENIDMASIYLLIKDVTIGEFVRTGCRTYKFLIFANMREDLREKILAILLYCAKLNEEHRNLKLEVVRSFPKCKACDIIIDECQFTEQELQIAEYYQ